MYRVISGGKVSVLGVDIIGHCEEKVHMNTRAIVNGCRVTAV
jgi:hypothetical protein